MGEDYTQAEAISSGFAAALLRHAWACRARGPSLMWFSVAIQNCNAAGGAGRKVTDYIADMNLLVIEDDATTGTYIARGLREEGHVVDLAQDGSEGLTLAAAGTYDVMIVDRMLPQVDGLTLVKTLREAGNTTPVLFLTAMGSVEDRIGGLNAGGDDYLVKPFAFGELSARVTALGRRPQAVERETALHAGDLTLDLLTRKVVRGDQEIDLLPREYALLEFLLRRKGRVQTRTMLLEGVWDLSFDPMTNVVETHVSRLRAKVDKPFKTELIKTVRGAGYRIDG